MLRDGDFLPPASHAIPRTHGIQLSSTARTLAGLAVTLGQAFTFVVLARVGDYDEDALVRGLDELWQRRMVMEQVGIKDIVT